MRLAVLALALAVPALSPAAAPRDWSARATRLPSGAFLIGNPAAPARLVEYASYTCSHCAEFAVQSEPVLKKRWIRSGSTSLEFRHLIRDGLDLGAAVVARCTGPAGFAATTADLFAQQGRWLPQGAEWQRANAQRIAMYPPADQLRALAEGAGLFAIGRAHGLTPARLDACFANGAEVDRILALTRAAPAEVRSTPTFFLNGRLVPDVDWARLQPVLRAAGAK
jgi:protein-disulfide isomerase